MDDLLKCARCGTSMRAGLITNGQLLCPLCYDADHPPMLAAAPQPPADDRLDVLQAENERLRAALRPFGDIAGEMLVRGWDASNVALALDNPNDPHRITAGDFFKARAALNGGGDE